MSNQKIIKPSKSKLKLSKKTIIKLVVIGLAIMALAVGIIFATKKQRQEAAKKEEQVAIRSQQVKAAKAAKKVIDGDLSKKELDSCKKLTFSGNPLDEHRCIAEKQSNQIDDFLKNNKHKLSPTSLNQVLHERFYFVEEKKNKADLDVFCKEISSLKADYALYARIAEAYYKLGEKQTSLKYLKITQDLFVEAARDPDFWDQDDPDYQAMIEKVEQDLKDISQ